MGSSGWFGQGLCFIFQLSGQNHSGLFDILGHHPQKSMPQHIIGLSREASKILTACSASQHVSGHKSSSNCQPGHTLKGLN